MALLSPRSDRTNARCVALDELLFEICQELQLSSARYKLAESRYKTIGELLCAPDSPFEDKDPQIYPQGSMRLGTTVKPIDGPFDLDFVCQLSTDYQREDPMDLLDGLFAFFKASERYKGMVERKNRCIRVVYADDFYMDILLACKDAVCGSCIQVPDCDLKSWKGSNPIGYAQWFYTRSVRQMYKFAMDNVAPLPGLERIEEKEVLQLVVQLLKRWRDLFYCESDYPPISVVLTTMAASLYGGEKSTSVALLNILERAVEQLDQARLQGHRLRIPNPVHAGEDFSERWNNRDNAYDEFAHGIRKFAKVWREICTSDADPKGPFARLFGEVVSRAVEKQAMRTQVLRENMMLGIKSSGAITTVQSGISRILPNTNYGTHTPS